MRLVVCLSEKNVNNNVNKDSPIATDRKVTVWNDTESNHSRLQITCLFAFSFFSLSKMDL